MNWKTAKTLLYIVLILLALYGILQVVTSFTKPGIRFSLTQSAVVLRIQSLSRLETASFTIEKIIEGGVQGNAFQNILYGDKILLIAHADVVAGFDFSKMADDDVRVVDNILTIHLPAPEILHSRLDNEKTHVYDRKLGFLTKGNENLESQARLTAEQSIRQAACEGNILDVATENAKKQLATMFSAAGFDGVVVTTEVGVCK